MKVRLVILAVILLAAVQASSMPLESHPIARSGSSFFQTVVEKRTIKVALETFVVKKGDLHFPPGFDDYGELSLIRSISIIVDGQTLWVPLSAYAGLFDARAAAVLFEKGLFVLSIAGSDGADAYQARIYFNSKRICRRAVYDLEASTKEPSEETRYAPPRVLY